MWGPFGRNALDALMEFVEKAGYVMQGGLGVLGFCKAHCCSRKVHAMLLSFSQTATRI